MGIAYAPKAALDPTNGAALLLVEADVTPGSEERALDVLRECVDATATVAPDADRLHRARSLILGRMVMRCATKAGLASILATAAGEHPQWLSTYADRVLAVTGPTLAETMGELAPWDHLSRQLTTAVAAPQN